MAGECEGLGQVVICGHEEVVHPGDQIGQFVAVTVDPGVAGATLENLVSVSGGGAVEAEASVTTEVGAQAPGFGFLSGDEGLAGLLSQADGTPVMRAGSTPFQLTVGVGFPSRNGLESLEAVPVATPRDVTVDLPPGLAFNPAATPHCQETQLELQACPPASQVGQITVLTSLSRFVVERGRLYNMVPLPGSAASFGVNLSGIKLHLLGGLRGGDFGLSAAANDLPGRNLFFGMQMQLWGNPSDPGHDAARGSSVEPQPQPLITLPSACGPLSLSARADSWENPGSFAVGSAPVEDLFGDKTDVEGCSGLEFDPVLSVQPTTTVADSAAGLEIGLDVPQDLKPTGATTSSLRRVAVALPAGISLNPAAVGELGACAPGQIGLSTPVGEAGARFDDSPAACPNAAKLGTVEAVTPLLQDEPAAGKSTARPLTGSIYLAEPRRNPFGSLFGLYAVLEDPESGIAIKLAGEVTPGPDGQLTASFGGLPQLPFEEFGLHFFAGSRGLLRTPALCGGLVSRAELTPWSSPAPVAREARSTVSVSPSGGACATVPAQQPHAPRFEAGTISPRAGRDSPFVLRVSRGDGSQELGALDVTLPPGLSGRLAGVAECGEGALTGAAARSASAETASPSCPAPSRVGRVTAALGAGPTPYEAEGSVYLAGPYGGAPLSLAVVTPAAAGPFDLGTVVVRVALFVDARTGQISARSDPLPRSLAGVPLDIRSLTLELSKPGLISNPTSCDPMSVDGVAISTSGRRAPLHSRFQAGNCKALRFDPKLALRLSGALGRNGHPGLRAVLSVDPRGAALASLGFALPAGELLDLRHVGELCPRDLAADRCPPASRLGSVRLRSPALDEPLTGTVYLRVPSRRLPEVSAELRSGRFRFLLQGRTTDAGGRLGLRLGSLPDIPLSRAVLTLAGGRRGIVVNSRSLCAGAGSSRASAGAHDGRQRRLHPRLRLDGRC